jgi:hypothetical protein
MDLNQLIVTGNCESQNIQENRKVSETIAEVNGAIFNPIPTHGCQKNRKSILASFFLLYSQCQSVQFLL